MYQYAIDMDVDFELLIAVQNGRCFLVYLSVDGQYFWMDLGESAGIDQKVVDAVAKLWR